MDFIVDTTKEDKIKELMKLTKVEIINDLIQTRMKLNFKRNEVYNLETRERRMLIDFVNKAISNKWE